MTERKRPPCSRPTPRLSGIGLSALAGSSAGIPVGAGLTSRVVGNPTSVGREGAVVVFTVVLDTAPSGPVTIPVASSNPAEGLTDVAELVFGPADWSTPQTVTVAGVDDADADGDIAYLVALGVAAGGGYDGIDPDDVGVTNLDDDAAATTGSISGRSWIDADFSDTFTVGDELIVGIGVHVIAGTDPAGPALSSTVTGGDGTYSFGGLAPGEYIIRFDDPPGTRTYWPVIEDSGDDSVDSDIFYDTYATAVITVVPGSAIANIDAGWTGDF